MPKDIKVTTTVQHGKENTVHWWNETPWRMVQTNLREIDMADLDAEKFAADLEDFGATVVNLNAAGILASYQSKLPYHTVSAYLTGASLQQILDACHKRGIRVIARCDFSKIPVAVYEQHPDWAFRKADGSVIEQNGFVQTCQNSVYQTEKVPEILRELLTTHDFDGVYCNMSGFIATDYNGGVHGFCTCDRCKAGFKAAFNMDAPLKPDMKDPVTMRYLGFQTGCGKKLRAAMNDVIKAINPEIALDKVDFLRTESHSEVDVPIWVYSASSNCRHTVGAERHMVSDNAVVDYMGFRYRECTICPEALALRQWQNVANGGSCSLYIIGRLDSHIDRSGFAPTKKVFQFHKKYADIISGLQSGAEILLVCKDQISRSDAESYGWIRALTASHIPFDECRLAGLNETLLAREQAVILADVKMLSREQAAMLDAFAQRGGTVIVSGEAGLGRQPLDCLGVTLGAKHKGCMSSVLKVEEPEFPRCAKAPLIAFGPEFQEVIPEENTAGYMKLVPEHPFGPPELAYFTEITDIPGLTLHPHGAGKGILIPWSIGAFYQGEGYTNTLNVIQDVLFSLCGIPEIAPKLHESVELVLAKKPGKTVISLINASGYFANSYFKPIPMADIKLTFPTGFAKAAALNGGHVTLDGNAVCLDRLNDFEMIVLEEEQADGTLPVSR